MPRRAPSSPADGLSHDAPRRRGGGGRELAAAAAVWFALLALFYAPTLGGHYQADDFSQVANRTAPDGRPAVARTFSDFFAPVVQDPNWRFHRPLWSVSLLLEAGPLRGAPWASRLILVALHAIGAALVAWILRRRGAPWLPSHLAAAAFALGPASAQVVTWIVARCDSMATTFGLAAVAARLVMAESSGARRGLWRTASLASFVAAVWSKESGFAFAPALLALALVDGARRDARAFFRRARSAVDVVVVAVALFAWRAHILGAPVGGYAGERVQRLPQAHLRDVTLPLFPFGLLPVPAATFLAPAAWLAVAWLVARARGLGREGLFVGTALLVTSLALTSHIPVVDHSNPETARLSHQPAAAWALIVGAGLSGAWSLCWTAAARRMVVALAMGVVAMAAAATWPLVRGHAEAGRIATALVDALREVAQEPDRGPVTLVGVPDAVGPGLVGRNVVGSALAPLALPWPPRNDIEVLTDLDAMTPAGAWVGVLPRVLNGEVAVRAWEEGSRRFVPGSFARGHVRVRARVRPLGAPGDDRYRLDAVPLELSVPAEGIARLRIAAHSGALCEIVLASGAEVGGLAHLHDLRPVPPTMLREPTGAAARDRLVVLGAPGERVLLLVGDRPGWLPLDAIGTSLVASPRLVPGGKIGMDGRREIALEQLADPHGAFPRYVQALRFGSRGEASLAERLDLDPQGPDFAGRHSSD